MQRRRENKRADLSEREAAASGRRWNGPRCRLDQPAGTSAAVRGGGLRIRRHDNRLPDDDEWRCSLAKATLLWQLEEAEEVENGGRAVAGGGRRMAVRRLVAAAAAVALLSLVLNNVAAFTPSWVLQEQDGRKRSVGLWRMCPASTEHGRDDLQAAGRGQGTQRHCTAIGWGSEFTGSQESRSTVKRKSSGRSAQTDTNCFYWFNYIKSLWLCIY